MLNKKQFVESLFYKAQKLESDEWVFGNIFIIDDEIRICTTCVDGGAPDLLWVCAHRVREDTVQHTTYEEEENYYKETVKTS